VYAQNGPFLWRTLQRLGVPASDLDDCLQEVLLVVHRRLDSYDPQRAKLTTWLFGICLRVAKRSRRRLLARREVSEPRPDCRVAGSTPEDEYDRAELRMVLDRALNSMDLEKRAALVFYELDGMKTEAIAELMGVPVGTVHSRLHAARKQLWRRLEAERRAPARQLATWGAALGPPGIRELLGEASPLCPMPHHVHLRALKQTARLAGAPGASLSTLLGGKALIGLVPAGMLLGVVVLSVGVPKPGISSAGWAPDPVAATPKAALAPPADDRPVATASPPRVVPAQASPRSDSVLELEQLPEAPEVSSVRRARPHRADTSTSLPAAETSTLAAEAELVANARRHLETSPSTALALGREYETRFPGGQLRSANDYVVVEALARLGRQSEARSEAVALAVRDPQGLFSRQALCVAEGRLPPSNDE